VLKESFVNIYQQNPASPVFVRVADILIAKNDVDQAIEVLNEGLKYFPDYPTALLMLGKAYMLAGSFNKAESYYKKGSKIINSPETLEYYLSELSYYKEQQKVLDELSNEPTEEKQKLTLTAEPVLPEPPKTDPAMVKSIKDIVESINSNKPQTEEVGKKSKTTIEEFNIDDLAHKLSSTVLPPVTPPVQKNNIEVVTEEMAQEYFSKANFKEAYEVYKKLKVIHPEKASKYDVEIQQLELLI